MTKTSYLLPHPFQRIGWVLLIASPMLLALELWIFNGLELIPQKYSQFGTLVLYLTLALAALFICLSEERQEDEFIRTLRLRSIANTAWICFVLTIVLTVVVEILAAFRTRGALGPLSYYRPSDSLILAFFLYIVIFRYRLCKYRREAGHEE